MMIEVDKLTKYFGPVLAVDHVSFSVDKGEIVGFLGLNGAGKTTTLRILTTYLPATSGVAQRGRVRRDDAVDGRAPQHRLPAGKRAALSGNARPRIHHVPGQAQGSARAADAPPASIIAWSAAGSAKYAIGCWARCPRAIASAWAWPTPWCTIRPS